jgi:2-oxoisovalerate dehydrogenase E1 component beta subunit
MTHIPGWKIVMPSNPLDAYGLLLAACKDENPVMYLEPKALLRIKGEDLIPGEPNDDKKLSKMIDAPLGDRTKWKPQWPVLEGYTVELGKAKLVTEGDALTVVSYGRTLPLCVKAAKTLAADGISAEVIDLRTLWPWDRDTVLASAARTKRLLVVHEAVQVAGFGAEIAATVAEVLNVPVKRLGAPRIPVGYAQPLENESRLTVDKIVATAKEFFK